MNSQPNATPVFPTEIAILLDFQSVALRQLDVDIPVTESFLDLHRSVESSRAAKFTSPLQYGIVSGYG
jgi:hypothetical protein